MQVQAPVSIQRQTLSLFYIWSKSICTVSDILCTWNIFCYLLPWFVYHSFFLVIRKLPHFQKMGKTLWTVQVHFRTCHCSRFRVYQSAFESQNLCCQCQYFRVHYRRGEHWQQWPMFQQVLQSVVSILLLLYYMDHLFYKDIQEQPEQKNYGTSSFNPLKFQIQSTFLALWSVNCQRYLA